MLSGFSPTNQKTKWITGPNHTVEHRTRSVSSPASRSSRSRVPQASNCHLLAGHLFLSSAARAGQVKRQGPLRPEGHSLKQGAAKLLAR
jgi:hypothetical protein